MPEGLIIKALSGYYYVQPLDRSISPIQCRARGIFKKRDVSPKVGDHVEYDTTENNEGWIQNIMERQTELVRPPIANVNLAVLVFSLAEPELVLQLLDKFLVHVEQAGMDALICFTKFDLLDDTEQALMNEKIQLYEQLGYMILKTSIKTGEGVNGLREHLNDKISVFSGQSGVGKSSLLNSLLPQLHLETSEISRKLGRGKHTTRHVELIPFGENGYVADTPGFSQLDFVDMDAKDLSNNFKELRYWSEDCKFRGCLHEQEPKCAVREALQDGKVAVSRYQSYLHFLKEIKETKRRY